MKTEEIPSATCPICLSPGALPFLQFKQLPVHCSLLWPTREAARSVSRGDICLDFCVHCGHIFNRCFDAALTQQAPLYEDSLDSSPCFQEYAARLARKLVQRHELRGKDAIEIGSGRGEFLALLCELGGNRGTGFDPHYEPVADGLSKAVTLIQDSFSERYAHYRADIVYCRHYLERVPQPCDFMALVRRTIGPRRTTAVFFEVSNVLFTLRQLAIWDLLYERCSYFSPRSLAHLFAGAGFKLVDLEETFDGRFLAIEATPAARDVALSEDYPEETGRLIEGLEAFAGQCWQKVAIWRQRLNRMAARKQRVVLWGRGRQVATFLNAVQVENSTVEYVVDEDPARNGKFVAGTAQQTVSPAFLKEYRPQTIIAFNSRRRQQIRQQAEALGLTPLIMVA
jgi:hypothetical protein